VDQLLVDYFYEGLQPMDRNMVDATSGGALVDKTPVVAKELIANMVANSQQFGTRYNSSALYHVQASSSKPNFPASSATDQQILTNKLDELASLVRQLGMSQTVHVSTVSPQPRVCCICFDVHIPLMLIPHCKKRIPMITLLQQLELFKRDLNNSIILTPTHTTLDGEIILI